MIMYKGYDILVTQHYDEVRNNMFTVYWYRFTGLGKTEKRGGFLDEVDAYGYAIDKIDERMVQLDNLRRLKHDSRHSVS